MHFPFLQQLIHIIFDLINRTWHHSKKQTQFPIYICIQTKNAGHFQELYLHGMCLEETHVTVISSFYKEIQQAESDLRLSMLVKEK